MGSQYATFNGVSKCMNPPKAFCVRLLQEEAEEAKKRRRQDAARVEMAAEFRDLRREGLMNEEPGIEESDARTWKCARASTSNTGAGSSASQSKGRSDNVSLAMDGVTCSFSNGIAIESSNHPIYGLDISSVHVDICVLRAFMPC
eukprot:jgi/Mesvir1/7177/Mv15058-RA.1